MSGGTSVLQRHRERRRNRRTDRGTERGPVMSRVCVCVGVCPFNRSSSHKPPPQPPSLDKAVASLFACACMRAYDVFGGLFV